MTATWILSGAFIVLLINIPLAVAYLLIGSYDRKSLIAEWGVFINWIAGGLSLLALVVGVLS